MKPNSVGLSGLLITGAVLSGCTSWPGGASQPVGPTVETRPVIGKPFVARGNEPFWRVSVKAEQLVYEPMGADVVTVPYERIRLQGNELGFRATGFNGLNESGGSSSSSGSSGWSGEHSALTLTIRSELCQDTMSGMPYPFRATLRVNGDERPGCAGEPADLIQGNEWVIEDIGGRGIIDSSRITIQFLEQGRVAGLGSCNRYGGQWKLSGEGLKVGPLMATRMACAPGLMDQEQTFFRTLEQVQRFEISSVGALELVTPDGVRLKGFPARE